MTENRLPVTYHNEPAYDIVLDQCFGNLIPELNVLGLEGRKLCVVSDDTVAPLHLDSLLDQLTNHGFHTDTFLFPAGEASKNIATVTKLYTFLIERSYDRNDCLLALGGGVTGDLTGFAAATYLRGIRFIQIPTSLLAMVDSSIGGKTGVDFESYKNMVGAFHQPILVYMNLETLLTLPEKEYLSGMGEIIKHGLIKDAAYYEWLKENREGILARDYDTLLTMIRVSCLIKRGVVERDPKEAGERAVLNFGHTLGHAVEKLMNLSLLHGECVAIGMAAASYISFQKGYLSKDDYEDILSTIQSFHLAVTVGGLDPEEVAETAGHDKKMDAGRWKFILLNGIGNAVIDRSVTKEEAVQAAAMLGQ